MKKNKKVTAIQIAPYHVTKPKKNKRKKSKIERELGINYLFKPHMGGIIYEYTKPKRKDDENGKDN